MLKRIKTFKEYTSEKDFNLENDFYDNENMTFRDDSLDDSSEEFDREFDQEEEEEEEEQRYAGDNIVE